MPLEAAQDALLATSPLPPETVALGEAAGRILARDVSARLTQPPADVSAMDGYALRHADLPGPCRLAGEVAAGAADPGRIADGEAMRIFTGAPLPEGADCVAIQEDVRVQGAAILLAGDGPAHPGANVRPAGQDFRAGDLLARAGERVTASRLGLLAAGGLAEVAVHRRPRVALVATGSELVPPGARPGRGQIVAGNGLMLARMLRLAGADVTDRGLVPDRLPAVADAIDAAARQADIVVTIGGASVGDHDLVRPALARLGARLDFWRLAIRPGKPLLAGEVAGARLLGLPGNPASAFVCAILLLLPLVRRLAGDPQAVPQTVPAASRVALGPNGPRRDFQRARLLRRADGGLEVEPFARQDSSLLQLLAAADALLVRPEQAPAVPAGTSVPVLLLDACAAGG